MLNGPFILNEISSINLILLVIFEVIAIISLLYFQQNLEFFGGVQEKETKNEENKTKNVQREIKTKEKVILTTKIQKVINQKVIMIMYKAISNVEKETKNVMNATVNAEKEIKIEGKEMKKKELVSIDEEKEVL
ncbi:MAG: hypothetical protein EZS28_025565 [Streblomastix strix]|uniref:Uncharacterized protein n=1 Tax=Streblomastix strix TaxID=222440 RepID=A0A5J4V8S2_9EUKA|nr:MAG: hypothetical protein EZS28_025565 [Streblomastix strix]